MKSLQLAACAAALALATVANAAITQIGPSNQFNVYNNLGTTGVVADLVGTFWLYPGTASGSAASGTSRHTPGKLPKPDLVRK